MTTGFSVNSLKVSTSDGRNFTLLEPFTYVTTDGTAIEVPAGSQSDGASTPRELWISIPPFGQYWMAAFLHDYLYRYSTYPKDFCDNCLLDAMTALGVSKVMAHIIYEGVALGGQLSFYHDRMPTSMPKAPEPAE